MTRFFVPAACRARVLPRIALEDEGTGNAGRVMRTRSLVCKNKKHTSVVTTGPPKHSDIPCANGFNGFLRALLGDRAFLPPSQATMRKHRRQLDTSVGVSEPHDFAVRDSARSSCAPSASTASRTYVRDDSRNAPLVRRDGEGGAADLGSRSTARACGKLARRANQFFAENVSSFILGSRTRVASASALLPARSRDQ
jgi:hypothetical protein